MQIDKYEPLLFSDDRLEFKFYSKGPKGEFPKLIQFIKTDNPVMYNLAFGNLLPDGNIDDQIRNDNKDRNRILATVAGAIFEFTARYPHCFVFFKGSTDERTRLYRMAISIYFNELSSDFEIFGICLDDGDFNMKPFIKGKEYYGFVIKRK